MTSSYTDWSRTGTRNRRSTRSAGAAPDRRSAAGSTSAGPPRCATTATLLAQVAGRPGDRAARPDPGYQNVDTAAGVLPDLRPGRAVVGVRIRPVVVCRGIHARSPSRASSCSAAAITPGIPSRAGLSTTVAPSAASTCRRSTLAVPGITIAHDSPRTTAACAKPMPVLPLVDSTTTIPGRSTPGPSRHPPCSARPGPSATRPGLSDSCLTTTSPASPAAPVLKWESAVAGG